MRRKQLPEQLKADGLQRSFATADFSTFQPGPPPYGVLREFLESLQPPSPEILFVDGLEYWIDAHPKPGGVLEELNLGRERLANLGVVVVFLLPVYLIDLIRSHALNLWSWRAHHYVLTSSEDKERHYGVPFPLTIGHIIAPGDTPEARERRIRILKKLLEEGLAEHRTPEALFRPILLPLVNELRDAGHFAEALQTLDVLGNIVEGIKDAQQKADIITLRGILLAALGDLNGAEPFLQRALLIQEEALPPNPLELASSLNMLAGLYTHQGRYTEAERLCQRALAIAKQKLGPMNPNIATLLNNLGEVYRSQGKHAEAESLYQQALAIDKEILGVMHPEVAASLNNLALLYDSQGKYTEAEPLYRQALAIAEQTLGPTHSNVAVSLNNLAEVYRSQGKYAEAEPLYQRALTIWETSLGQEHPNFIATLRNYAVLLRNMKRDAEAEPLEIQARELEERHERRDMKDQV